MKNKKNIKVLLPLVVIIWGILIFKIVDAFRPDDMNLQQGVVSSFKAPSVKEKEQFNLIAVESDPFLGTPYAKSSKKDNRAIKKVQNETPWPNIQYLGLVSDNNSKSKIFIISINGQQQLLAAGEITQDVKVVKGNSESVTLRFNGHTQVYSIM